MMLKPEHKVAILLHHGILGPKGKTGLTMLRYGRQDIVAVIDRECAGRPLEKCAGIDRDVPVVETVEKAAELGADVLVIGIAPSGGRLPPEWRDELVVAIRNGMSLVNGLHSPLSEDPRLREEMDDDQWIRDVRREPDGLSIARGRAAELSCTRVLTVGTDMAIGKKCTALEMTETARRRGMESRFVATGQSGIIISGRGVAIDAVRVDYAASAIENAVLEAGDRADVVFLEGQGSLLHPGSSATLPLIRGMQPTHLVLVHRPDRSHLHGFPDLKIPPLSRVGELYETVAAAAGVLYPAEVAAISLNTSAMGESEARAAIESAARETDLPCTDPIRYGADALVEAILCR
ncbi:MAG: DUF1611 domain-containing protein [Candidatus Brocadiia bacterium]